MVMLRCSDAVERMTSDVSPCCRVGPLVAHYRANISHSFDSNSGDADRDWMLCVLVHIVRRAVMVLIFR